jgi:molybdopterin/thiamine biosynthesis adenylyltransferase
MTDHQLLRYSRHILLPQIGVEGQEKLLAARALIVGAGGLGSPIALYLAAAGVGHITLCDGDTVDLTNLQRQIAHHSRSIGHNKALSARDSMAALNPEIELTAITRRLEGIDLNEQIAQADIVLDASDNFATRHAINRACQQHKKPLVSGAAIRFDGQVTVFNFTDPASPCYHCLFPEDAADEGERCAVMGVFSPLVGIIGSIQAAEALKCLTGIGQTLQGRLLLIDGLTMEMRQIRLKKDSDCPVCGFRARK